MMSQANPAPRRRWRWALSLRTLMVLVLVVGGPLGWLARRISIQRAAVARIREAGGGIAYDYQSPPGGLASPGASPPAPAWVRRVIGDELFQEVHTVSMGPSGLRPGEPTDATMAAIAALDHLEGLNFIYPPLTDAQLARLGVMPALKIAILLDTKLTASGLDSIRTWPKLERLAVRFDREVPAADVLGSAGAMPQLKLLNVSPLRDATPADFRPLAGLANLEYLAVRPSPRDESCLVPVVGLRRLTGMHLLETNITDAGMRRLAALNRLQRVELAGAAVTDSGLAIAARWPDLQLLDLIGSTSDGAAIPVGAITDRGLDHLRGLTGLTTLMLAGRFTDAGLTTLSRLPKLETLSLYGIEEAATVAGLRAVLAVGSLQSLGLAGPGVRDDWAIALAGHPRLVDLTLSGPRLTDAALVSLAALPLRSLALIQIRITDAGLMALARDGCKVRALKLRETAVTPAGVAAFRAACPACQVDYRPGAGRP